MSAPRALVLRAPGTNRDHDVAYALTLAGSEPTIATMAEAGSRPELWADSQLFVVAGGFSYADALGAGLLLGHELAAVLTERFQLAVEAGKPVIGICNGFQALVRSGLLPGAGFAAALGHNAGGSFQCRWVRLAPTSTRSVWTRDLVDPIDCPIAHGEGRFSCDDETAAHLAAAGQIALTYIDGPDEPAESGVRHRPGGAAGPDGLTGSGVLAGSGVIDANPNGSTAGIAGVCDSTGLVLGLMPHPENHVIARQHPLHRRGGGGNLGLPLFQSGVRHAKEL